MRMLHLALVIMTWLVATNAYMHMYPVKLQNCAMQRSWSRMTLAQSSYSAKTIRDLKLTNYLGQEKCIADLEKNTKISSSGFTFMQPKVVKKSVVVFLRHLG